MSQKVVATIKVSKPYTRPDGSPPIVIVVEDEAEVLDLMENRIRKAGYQLLEGAISGEEALTIINQAVEDGRKPDLLLSDIKLAGKMTGIELAQIVYDRWHIPVIFTSAYADDDTLEQAVESDGAYGHLVKPISERSLKAMMTIAFKRLVIDNEMIKTKNDLRASQIRHDSLLQSLPLAAFERDISNVLSEMHKLKATGINDLRRYFRDHPQEFLKIHSLGQTTMSNKGLFNLADADTGAPTADITKSILGSLSKSELIRITNFYCDIMENGNGSLQMDTEMISLKGQRKFISIYATSLVNNYISVTMIDLTSHKQIENRLRVSMDRYKLLFHFLPIPAYERDLSVVLDTISVLKKQGITDFRNYFSEHPHLFRSLYRTTQITVANRQLRNLLELNENQDIPPLLSLFSEEDFLKFQEVIIQQTETGTISWQHETDITTTKGNKRHVLYQASLLDDKHMLVVIVDVTERHTMEQNLHDAIELAQNASQAKSDFLARMSHELRTPLNALINIPIMMLDDIRLTANKFIELERESGVELGTVFSFLLDQGYCNENGHPNKEFLANHNEAVNVLAQIGVNANKLRSVFNAVIAHFLTEDHQTKLQQIAERAQFLLSIVNDILDLSKVEAGKLEFENVSYSLRSIINNVIQNGRVYLKAHGKAVQLDSFIISKISKYLIGDPIRMEQILNNLVMNAAKFTNQGEIRIIVSVQNQRLKLEIQDSGIGIPADKIDKIFQEFEQADESITRRFGGTGLGLSITKRIVELMDGSISVSSTMNRGSSFTIDLPYFPTNIKTAQLSSSQTIISVSHPYTVLVAEDDKINQEVVRDVLSRAGYHVIIASDGAEAFQMMRSTANITMILMDQNMPNMDGLEATLAIREWEKGEGLSRIPIIALTADAMKGVRDRCLEAGMDDVVTKPFNMGILTKTMFMFTPEAKIDIADDIEEEVDRIDYPPENNLQAELKSFNYEIAIGQIGILSILKNFINGYRKSFPENLRELEVAISQSNKESAERISHTLKGLSAQCGAELLSESARTIHQILQKNELFSQKEMLLAICRRMLQEFEAFDKAVQENQSLVV